MRQRVFGLATLLAVLPAAVFAFDLRITSTTVNDDLSDDIKAASLVVGLKTSDQPRTAQDIVAAARADYANLVGALYENGHFSPVVSIKVNGQEAASISALSPPRTINSIVISLQPGPVFRFGRADLTPLPRGTTPPDGFGSGQVATTRAMRQAVDDGVSSWRDAGHAKARLSRQTITARHDATRLDAELRLDPGPKLRFGDLRISGNRAMRTERIRDIAGLPTGKVFNPEDLERAATRLRRTGVFQSVALTESDQIGPEQTLDIALQVAEAKPRRIGFGAEVSTQEGLSVSGFWLHRNLFGGGERLRLEAEISGIEGDTGGEDYELGFTFGRPATFNEDTDFYATGRIARRDEPNFSSDRITLEAGIRRYASPEREYTFGIGFDAANTTDAFGSNSYRMITFPMSAEFDYRDSELNATSGYYLKASLTPFVGLEGTSNGLRSTLDARAYRSFGQDDRLTFAVRGQLGSVVGPDLRNTPTDFLFYSGGGGTVRGHEYQSLGVDLGGGQTSGGRSFLALSGEMRVKTTDRLSLVGFIDAGYIGSETFPDGSSGDWHTGAGAGIRYDTGIGPVRLDVAVPVSGPGNPGGFQVYIGIGQAF